MVQRPHFSYAVYELKRFRFLLAVPLARTVWAVLQGRVPMLHGYEWVVGGLIVGYVWLKWACCRYELSASGKERFHEIRVSQGLLCRRTLHIAAEDAASVETECSPLLRLLGGCRVRVNTAGLRRRADVQLYLSASLTRFLFSVESDNKEEYRARRWPALVMALTGSNAAVGLLTAAPILRYSSRPEDWKGTLKALADWNLPLLLRIVANGLLIGWGVAAVCSFLRYAGFRAQRDPAYLRLVSGVFTRRNVLLDCRKITAVELRQTLSMRLLHLYTVAVTAAGYGRDIGARPVLLPVVRSAELGSHLAALLPEFAVPSGRVRPVSGAWRRYTAAPLFCLLGGVGLWMAGGRWHTVGLLWLLFSAWWLAVRGYACRCAGGDCRDGMVCLCYPRGLAVHRVCVPMKFVDCVTVTQSPWQRRRGSCTVRVRCFGEKKRVHRLWEMPYAAVHRCIQ